MRSKSAKNSQFSPARDIFDYDARRAARFGWLFLTAVTIIAIAQTEKQIQSWQIKAISCLLLAAIFALVIERVTQSKASFIPLPLTHLGLPLYFAYETTKPWVSYGLITITTIVYIVALENTAVILTAIIALTLFQRFVASLNYPSISDNVDDALLGGYFSTSWCLVVGFGALLLKNSYLRYTTEIEKTVSKINELQLTEKAKLSQLNLRDFENSQLHGTILNTLIAIRNAPHLLHDKALITQYLRDDLAHLKSMSKSESLDSVDLLHDLSNLPLQREIELNLEIEEGIKLNGELKDLIREILRELVLNTKKHTNASVCSLKIYTVDFVSHELVEHDLPDRKIVIEASDNSPEVSAIDSKQLLSGSRGSNSLARLIRNINGELEVTMDEERIIRRAVLPLPNQPEYYVKRVISLRAEAIKYIGFGYIRISFLFGLIALPGYLYLGLDRRTIALLLIHFIFTGGALLVKNRAEILAGLGAIIAVSIFPFMSQQDLQCSQIQYLPWLFNSIIGSIFLISLFARNKFVRWIPAVIFYISCIEIANQLPDACRNLLDGSTPAIILICLIAVGISIARKRDVTSESKFLTEAQREFVRISTTRDLIIVERDSLIHEIEVFVSAVEQVEDSDDFAAQINILILKIRAFLLSSEHFDNLLVQRIYYLVRRRLSENRLTYLEINTSIFPAPKEQSEIDGAIEEIENWGSDSPIKITFSREEDLLLSVSLEADQTSEESKSGHHKENLAFHFAF